MSDRLVASGPFVAGWLDMTIHDFVNTSSPTDPDAKYALITCVDSNRSPSDLIGSSPELRSLKSSLKIVGSAILIRTSNLRKFTARHRLFFGFDEIWFFPSKEITPKPEAVWLVGPSRIAQSQLNRLRPWMKKNACSLGLGGGEGLNFVVRAQGLSRVVLGHSIEQREPSTIS